LLQDARVLRRKSALLGGCGHPGKYD